MKDGPPPPLRWYREKQLETELVCDSCTLRYAVYGVFAFCPHCGEHNSGQILNKNLDLVIKELDLAESVADKDLQEHLRADAMENIVSAFDGFGRELCRVHAQRASNPNEVGTVSFQSLTGADRRLNALFCVRLSALVSADEWTLAVRVFQKRHLVAHNAGVVDQRYLDATGDGQAIKGRKIHIDPEEVRSAVKVVRVLGDKLSSALAAGGAPTTP